MAGYFPFGAASPNGNIGGWLATPDQDPGLTMLEELGMPIMHSDVPKGTFWESMLGEQAMSATNLMSTGGRTSGRV